MRCRRTLLESRALFFLLALLLERGLPEVGHRQQVMVHNQPTGSASPKK
jgi:hypothetical protein